MKECHTMEPSHTLDHEIPQTELKASVRPSASSLLPTTSEPETREQRLGEHRNSAYKEKVSVRRVDPEAEEDRRRVMITLGLEVALAMFLTLASKLWGWAREERRGGGYKKTPPPRPREPRTPPSHPRHLSR
jgi:hypothetical protein